MDERFDQLPPEVREDAALMAEEIRKKRHAKPGLRTATEVINEGSTQRPFSLRMSARELHRLRVLAAAENKGPTEFARDLILRGMERIEAQLLSSEKRRQAETTMELLERLREMERLVESIRATGQEEAS